MPDNVNENEPSLESFNEPASDAAKKQGLDQTSTKQTLAADEENADADKSKNNADVEDIYASLDDVSAEGVAIDKDTLKSFKDIAKANNISIEAAKSIVELQVNLAKKQSDDFKALQKSWEDASKVVYGDNLKNVETNCSRVLAELDKDGKFKELLALAGAEKHPATLGFLKAVGDKMLEKPAVNPSATVSGNEREPELEDFN